MVCTVFDVYIRGFLLDKGLLRDPLWVLAKSLCASIGWFIICLKSLRTL